MRSFLSLKFNQESLLYNSDNIEQEKFANPTLFQPISKEPRSYWTLQHRPARRIGLSQGPNALKISHHETNKHVLIGLEVGFQYFLGRGAKNFYDFSFFQNIEASF
jgi:hypothetical protein